MLPALRGSRQGGAASPRLPCLLSAGETRPGSPPQTVPEGPALVLAELVAGGQSQGQFHSLWRDVGPAPDLQSVGRARHAPGPGVSEGAA